MQLLVGLPRLLGPRAHERLAERPRELPEGAEGYFGFGVLVDRARPDRGFSLLSARGMLRHSGAALQMIHGPGDDPPLLIVELHASNDNHVNYSDARILDEVLWKRRLSFDYPDEPPDPHQPHDRASPEGGAQALPERPPDHVPRC
jgi:hypothetical protein